ncbi:MULTISPECIES: hypothetical protein [Pseudanabaena]|uniref:Uncharacterized protein n=2 Tax=Pseudanabaena TaxID=1152 RepID=L8MX28_9CYAN|nr:MULTISPECIES: hypothetical protein [Pseudanabaena]ELS32552.1 hypothetical protein Pse7429DRAFT_2268 [Pseudanabaena biceps PCC 7429]MDG3495211.1 hypothetical protein [Pseudanabaena catenata USMAC16]
MLLTPRSVKSRFRAIFTSILLTAPPNLPDRLEPIVELIINDNLNALKTTKQNDQTEKIDLTQIDLTIAAIGIGAYWHQDLQEMRSRLLALQSHSKADIQELVLAYVIALACLGELHPRLLINHICDDFQPRIALSRTPQSQQQCLAQLQLVQQFVECGASTIASHRENGLSDAIASSLYYFLSTHHSWRIVTTRAQRHPQPNQLQVTIQSGAIAAAYLGEVNSPIAQDQANFSRISTKAIILGDRLWSAWVGLF